MKMFAEQKRKLIFYPLGVFFSSDLDLGSLLRIFIQVEKLKILFLDGLCQKMATYDNC